MPFRHASPSRVQNAWHIRSGGTKFERLRKHDAYLHYMLWTIASIMDISFLHQFDQALVSRARWVGL